MNRIKENDSKTSLKAVKLNIYKIKKDNIDKMYEYLKKQEKK